MRYGTAKFIVEPWDRKSLSFYVPQVQDYLNDNIYIWDSVYKWTCIKYFFEKPSDLIIDNETLKGLSVDYMTKDSALIYLRTNTNLKEVEPWKFLVSPETEIMWEIIPERFLIIE